MAEEGKMVMILSDRAMPNPLSHQGPEVYAPPHRRVPEEPVSDARIAFLRPQTAEHSQSNRSAENLDVLIQRVAGNSMDEIDHVILELEAMREMLRNEGARDSQQ